MDTAGARPIHRITINYVAFFSAAHEGAAELCLGRRSLRHPERHLEEAVSGVVLSDAV